VQSSVACGSGCGGGAVLLLRRYLSTCPLSGPSASHHQPMQDYDENGPFPWEEEIEEELREFVEAAEFDKSDGSVTIQIGDDEPERFGSYNDLYHALVHWGDFELSTRAPEDYDLNDSDQLVSNALDGSAVESFFNKMEAEDRKQLKLVFPPVDSKELTAPLRIDFADISYELIKWLAQHPDRMHQLHHRKFGELMAELFRSKGYTVEMTQKTRDGGRDLRVIRKEPFGSLLTLVECKKYSPTNKVGVGVVRSLLGVMDIERATNGVIAT